MNELIFSLTSFFWVAESTQVKQCFHAPGEVITPLHILVLECHFWPSGGSFFRWLSLVFRSFVQQVPNSAVCATELVLAELSPGLTACDGLLDFGVFGMIAELDKVIFQLPQFHAQNRIQLGQDALG